MPRLQIALVARERLWTRLDAGLQCKLILLCAPAGFGKTTLAGQWLNARRTRAQLPQMAWVSLDSGDNDPLRFWRYIITACQNFQPNVDNTSLSLLSLALPPSFELPSLENVLTSLLNELARSECAGLLVLEDYHLITEVRIHETLIIFLDHLPPNLHVVMLTRSEPPFPLVRFFLDEGEPLASLLQSILPVVRGKAQLAALKRLLLAFAQQRATSDNAPLASPLAEPLSAQEQRVLRLLAAGHSNPEIAHTLVVSVNTVKAQVQSIYRKLNVTNRVEASEVARLLNLL